MMPEGLHILKKYTSYWQTLRVLESVIYGLAAAIITGLVSQNIGYSIIAFLIGTIIAVLCIRPWKITLIGTTHHINKTLETAEYSSELLTLASSDLSGIARLQKEKITQRLREDIKSVKPKTGLKRAILVSISLCILSALLAYYFLGNTSATPKEPTINELVTFTHTDSLAPDYQTPKLVKQSVTIKYPRYTNQPNKNLSSMNVSVLEGSTLTYSLVFDGPVEKAFLEGFDRDIEMRIVQDTAFAKAVKSTASVVLSPAASGYYNFTYTDTVGSSFASDIYAVEVVKDLAPEIEIKGMAPFTSFEVNDEKILNFTTKITDDYGLGAAKIIATVSKGSGESVKFREEQIPFDEAFSRGTTAIQLTKKLDLKELQMELGDELYFYVETEDLKIPRPNVSRSETMFAVLKDTSSLGFGVEGTLGADLMPDYFRSQRQLIIDTEKLIKERSQISEKEFKSRSNELGFDQKALRLKYGQFMGDEDDSGIIANQTITTQTIDEEDPTAGFRHDHDSENEHHLVEDEHDHDHEETESSAKSPLDDYVHNHDDPEESTLFTASLKSKLKQAMAEMWDSELHLRLADPQTSLPYQNNALKLIQEIKNSARIYVHRIGFDPPPIKEEKRLSGDLENIGNYFESEDFDTQDPHHYMRESIRLLEMKKNISDHKDVFKKAGEELARIAIKEPSKHLRTLQQLKWLTEDRVQPEDVLISTLKGLLNALPSESTQPLTEDRYSGKLEAIFYKKMQTRD